METLHRETYIWKNLIGLNSYSRQRRALRQPSIHVRGQTGVGVVRDNGIPLGLVGGSTYNGRTKYSQTWNTSKVKPYGGVLMFNS